MLSTLLLHMVTLQHVDEPCRCGELFKSNRYETNLGVLMSSLNGILPLLVIGPLVLDNSLLCSLFFARLAGPSPWGPFCICFYNLFSAAKGSLQHMQRAPLSVLKIII